MTYENELNLERGECYADSARGVYIPQYFAESIHRNMVSGVSDEQFSILESGPDHEHYWDVWSEVLDSCELNHPTLGLCRLWQDGDLWVYVVADQESTQ